jgi:hypothetical protein
MSVTPQVYAKARSEIIALFGWNADSLTPDQTLRVDCAVALRLALDDLQGRICRGDSIDVARMLTASEALARLLPPTVLATPPAEQHGDPRQVMWEIYKQMRERGEIGLNALPEGGADARIEELTHENERLRARLAGKGVPAIDPAEVVPPSEYLGVPPMRGPDDPPKRAPVTIEAKAVPPAPAARAAPPLRPAWEDWLDAGGYGGPGYDRWADNR